MTTPQQSEARQRRRLIEQPGAPLLPRRICEWAEAGTELRLTLGEGADLLPELAKVLSSQDIKSAALQIISGHFDRVSYFTGMIDKSGARVATYGAPRVLKGPVLLLGANAIFGLGEAGVPLVHCHAVMVDADNRVHGGHLPLEGCALGSDGAVVIVTPLRKAGFAVAYDSETNYSLFHPVSTEPMS